MELCMSYDYCWIIHTGTACLFGFYDISTFVGYLMPNPFYTNKQLYFKQFILGISTQFNCQKHFYFKLFSLVKQFLFKQFSLV